MRLLYPGIIVTGSFELLPEKGGMPESGYGGRPVIGHVFVIILSLIFWWAISFSVISILSDLIAKMRKAHQAVGGDGPF